LRKLLIEKEINIVHSHQRIDTIYAWLVCFGLKIKIIQTIHEFDFRTSNSYKILVHLSFIVADKDIFVSLYQKNYYAFNYKYINKFPLEVVYNGINFEKFNLQTQSTSRNGWKLTNDTLVMGMVGNFNFGHDQMTICRFLILLTSLEVNFKFLFIGKKDLSNPKSFDDCFLFCQNNGLADKCLFLGSRSDVPTILSQLDAFFYSSDHDTFGISVIEAIATGIPVFVNDWNVMREITENGDRAIIYKSKDEYDLLNKFNVYNSNPELHKLKAKENAIWAKKTYSIENHLKGLFSVYTDIME
jgi:glycosyltransferase involved in cell wall biosynthesis